MEIVNHTQIGSKTGIKFNATLAQLVERLTCNEDVVSSTLTGGSILGEMAERLKAAVC